jgi:hypothetical protein
VSLSESVSQSQSVIRRHLRRRCLITRTDSDRDPDPVVRRLSDASFSYAWVRTSRMTYCHRNKKPKHAENSGQPAAMLTDLVQFATIDYIQQNRVRRMLSHETQKMKKFRSPFL